MNDAAIASILHKLNPTGSQGFEGLVARLLETLTERRFFLARSGRQEGRDMTSNAIAVECKRYDKDTPLNEDELTSKLVHAISDFPSMELWVLVANRSVEDQLITRLRSFGRKDGVEVFIISSEDGDPSSLSILCANGSSVIRNFKTDSWPDDIRADLIKQLEVVVKHPNYNARRLLLKNELNSPAIGIDHLRERANLRLFSRLATENDSRAEFHQPLHVASGSPFLIKRSSANSALDSWFNSWAEHKNIFVMMGEEGDGKTWAVASWLAEKIKSANVFPPVLFFPSLDVRVNKLESLIVERLERKLDYPEPQPSFWGRRLERWKQAAPGKDPLLFLVIDGINERHSAEFWQVLIDEIQGNVWKDKLAIVITCRTRYWERFFSPLKFEKVQSITLTPFSPNELTDALKKHGLNKEDFPGELISLMAKPRYFDMAVKYRAQMLENGDYTVARLIYEDWGDRYKRKRGIGIDTESFPDFLKDLVNEYLSQGGQLKSRKVQELIPVGIDVNSVLEELRTGGVLDGHGDKYEVNEHKLILGLGLLLADAASVPGEPFERIRDIIDSLLEPRGADIQAKVCSMAVCVAMDTPGYSRDGQFALLQAWIECQNLYRGFESDFQAYMPKNPILYFDLIEYYWAHRRELHSLETLLLLTVVRWSKEREDILGLLSLRVERWLSLININGFPWMGGNEANDREKIRRDISERAGEKLVPGVTLTKYGRQFSVTDDEDTYYLWQAAYGIISCLPLETFIRAIATGCISDEIIGYSSKGEYASWVLNGYEKSVSSLIMREAEEIASSGDNIALRAAYRLLSYEASDEAIFTREKLPKDLFPVPELLLKHRKDPCLSFFRWKRQECDGCLTRDDVPVEKLVSNIKFYIADPSLPNPDGLVKKFKDYADSIDLSQVRIGVGQTHEDLLYDDIELVLCHFAPDKIVRLIKQMIPYALERTGISLRTFAGYLRRNSLVLGPEEHTLIRQAWEKTASAPTPWDKDIQYIEMYLFSTVLKGLSASEQLNALLSRPEGAFNWTELANSFKPVNNWKKIEKILIGDSDKRHIWMTLWFLSENKESVPFEGLALLVPFTDHEDADIRRLSLKIFCDEKVNYPPRILPKNWRWTPGCNEEEALWGSCLLAEATELLSYKDIRDRISPEYIYYALEKRKIHEMEKYKEEVGHILKAQNKFLVDHDKNGIYQPTLTLFQPLFEEITKEDSEIFKFWIRPVLAKAASYEIQIAHYQLIYDAFCRKLLTDKPEIGVKFYQTLKTSRIINDTTISGIGCSFIDFYLFRVPAHPSIVELWDRWAGKMASDEDLLILTIITRDNEPAESWLREYIRRSLESGVPFYKAQSFMLLGFLGESNREMDERAKHKYLDIWLDQVAHNAVIIRQRDEWARYWYEVFLNNENNIEAWAAFKLFLQCVDRRFQNWRKVLERKHSEAQHFRSRRPFLWDNEEEIKQAIKKNEENYSKQFLGHKVENGLWL